MSLVTTFPAIILDTIVRNLIPLFLAGALGDKATAREAALELLGEYHPKTEDELFLAATIVACDFAALDALGRAATPHLSMTDILRLRQSAVSVSLEAERSRRRLAECQELRRGEEFRRRAATPEPSPVQPAATEISELPAADAAAEAIRVSEPEGVIWTQVHHQRHRDGRFVAGHKKRPPTLH